MNLIPEVCWWEFYDFYDRVEVDFVCDDKHLYKEHIAFKDSMYNSEYDICIYDIYDDISYQIIIHV